MFLNYDVIYLNCMLTNYVRLYKKIYSLLILIIKKSAELIINKSVIYDVFMTYFAF